MCIELIRQLVETYVQDKAFGICQKQETQEYVARILVLYILHSPDSSTWEKNLKLKPFMLMS